MLKSIDKVEPINENVADCLAEIREVLCKHAKLDRFGIALLHSHFTLGDGEIMLETCDVQSRTLTTKPTKCDLAVDNVIGTVWALQDSHTATMAYCKQYCRRSLLGHDTGHHRGK